MADPLPADAGPSGFSTAFALTPAGGRDGGSSITHGGPAPLRALPRPPAGSLLEQFSQTPPKPAGDVVLRHATPAVRRPPLTAQFALGDAQGNVVRPVNATAPPQLTQHLQDTQHQRLAALLAEQPGAWKHVALSERGDRVTLSCYSQDPQATVPGQPAARLLLALEVALAADPAKDPDEIVRVLVGDGAQALLLPVQGHCRFTTEDTTLHVLVPTAAYTAQQLAALRDVPQGQHVSMQGNRGAVVASHVDHADPARPCAFNATVSLRYVPALDAWKVSGISVSDAPAPVVDPSPVGGVEQSPATLKFSDSFDLGRQASWAGELRHMGLRSAELPPKNSVQAAWPMVAGDLLGVCAQAKATVETRERLEFDEVPFPEHWTLSPEHKGGKLKISLVLSPVDQSVTKMHLSNCVFPPRAERWVAGIGWQRVAPRPLLPVTAPQRVAPTPLLPVTAPQPVAPTPLLPVTAPQPVAPRAHGGTRASGAAAGTPSAGTSARPPSATAWRIAPGWQADKRHGFYDSLSYNFVDMVKCLPRVHAKKYDWDTYVQNVLDTCRASGQAGVELDTRTLTTLEYRNLQVLGHPVNVVVGFSDVAGGVVDDLRLYATGKYRPGLPW